MSRSPSPSRSKIADERLPSGAITMILPRCPRHEIRAHAFLQAVELEPRRVRPAAPAGLDPQREFGIHELRALVVQQHRVDAVSVRVVHAGRDEDVVPAVCVDVADARSPRPVVLRADRGRTPPRTRPPPRLWKKALPKTNVPARRPGFPSAGEPGPSPSRALAARFSNMSECISVMKRSGRPSLSKSKNLIPIAPQGVLGKYSAVRSTNARPPAFSK